MESSVKTLLAHELHRLNLTVEAAVRKLNEFAEREEIDATISGRHLGAFARGERDVSKARAGTRELLQRFFGQSLQTLMSSPTDLETPTTDLSVTNDGCDLAVPHPGYPDEAGTAVTALTSLVSADLRGELATAARLWPPTSAADTITRFLSAQSSMPQLTSASSAAVADPIRATTHVIMDLDFQMGGGHTRAMLLGFFQRTVAPLLHQDRGEEARRALFAAAAETAQLLGWTSYDAGLHGAAYTYFTQGLRLAREADDGLLAGRLLSNLSHQANYTGQFRDALAYARTARSAVFGVATPSVTALVYAMEARALASLEESHECAEVMHRADRALSRRNPGDEPGWVSYVDQAEIAGEWAHCLRDLGQSTQAMAFVEQAVPTTPTRTTGLLRMVGADAALQAGDLDRALSLAHDGVELAGALQSQRYVRYVTDFHSSLAAQLGADVRADTFTSAVKGHYPELQFPGRRYLQA